MAGVELGMTGRQFHEEEWEDYKRGPKKANAFAQGHQLESGGTGLDLEFRARCPATQHPWLFLASGEAK